MKAAVLLETNSPLVIESVDVEKPREQEVQIRITATGICHSDLHNIKGEWDNQVPVILGHEGAGIVEAVGDGVYHVEPGDNVILSFRANCGRCGNCVRGIPALCNGHNSPRQLMHDGSARVSLQGRPLFVSARLGTWAEQVVCPAEQVIPIKGDIPPEVAALIGCCVTTGVGSVINIPATRAGMTVAVFGCGGVGLSVIQGARLLNASKIIAVDIFDHKLEFAYKFGATDVVNSREVDPVEAIKELTGGGADMAFDSFGSAQTVNSSVMALRKAGTAVMIGLGPVGDTAPIDMVDFLRNQKSLLSSYYGAASPHETFDKLIDFYLKGLLDVESLITRTYPLERINEGFDALARGEDGRGIVVFS